MVRAEYFVTDRVEGLTVSGERGMRIDSCLNALLKQHAGQLCVLLSSIGCKNTACTVYPLRDPASSLRSPYSKLLGGTLEPCKAVQGWTMVSAYERSSTQRKRVAGCIHVPGD